MTAPFSNSERLAMPLLLSSSLSLAVVLLSLGLSSGSLAADSPATKRGAVSVSVVATKDGWQLQRAGKPYFINGAGGSGPKKPLAAAGANSLRTWGTDHLETILDECEAAGLTVCVGIWLGHERHGFNYNDAEQVASQLEKARETVTRFKDHPAVLLWGIGNEMEGYAKGDNAAIWSAINTIASMAKRLDPQHPTMTVVAEIGGQRVPCLHRLCPDIDIVGINSYGGSPSLPQRYREAGGSKPFIVTEFGPAGAWESGKTSWGSARELSSTAKAESYRQAYRTQREATGLCFGGYAFTWGAKQEASATWFGLLLADGRRTEGVDALSELWTGQPVQKHCPKIESLKLIGDEQVEPGAIVKATLSASDLDRDDIKVEWRLQAEPSSVSVGGDAEEVPAIYPEAIVRGDLKSVEVRLPKDGGGYRLFAIVDDGQQGAAVANIPLFVKGPVRVPEARVATLPLIVYAEADAAQTPYIPAGWMGNTKATKLDSACKTNPHAGKTCLRIDYSATDGWAGVVWQSPEGDWGDKAGGWNLTGAKRLTFWARGEVGGEVVSFEFGLLGKDKKFSDSGRHKLPDVSLTREWKQYSLDLAGRDLSRIKTGFAWTLAATGKPVTLYLDDIEYGE